MELIAQQVLSSSTASLTFSSIPGTFRDLVLVVDTIRATTGSTTLGVRFNANTGNSYHYVTIEGNGSNTNGPTGTDTFVTASAFTNVFNGLDRALIIYNIMDYSTSNKNIPVLSRASNASAVTALAAGRWGFAGPVTQVDVFATTGQFATGSIFTLYGIPA
jgi:hypothetical protein